jgi:hypothetical protein
VALLALALLAVVQASPAWAQQQLPGDEAPEPAARVQLRGDPWRAEALLRRRAEVGHCRMGYCVSAPLTA